MCSKTDLQRPRQQLPFRTQRNDSLQRQSSREIQPTFSETPPGYLPRHDPKIPTMPNLKRRAASDNPIDPQTHPQSHPQRHHPRQPQTSLGLTLGLCWGACGDLFRYVLGMSLGMLCSGGYLVLRAVFLWIAFGWGAPPHTRVSFGSRTCWGALPQRHAPRPVHLGAFGYLGAGRRWFKMHVDNPSLCVIPNMGPPKD